MSSIQREGDHEPFARFPNKGQNDAAVTEMMYKYMKEFGEPLCALSGASAKGRSPKGSPLECTPKVRHKNKENSP